jgi:hypothetical protein
MRFDFEGSIVHDGLYVYAWGDDTSRNIVVSARVLLCMYVTIIPKVVVSTILCLAHHENETLSAGVLLLPLC